MRLLHACIVNACLVHASCAPVGPLPSPSPTGPKPAPLGASPAASAAPAAPAIPDVEPATIERPVVDGCTFAADRADLAIGAVTTAEMYPNTPSVSHRSARAKVSLGGDVAWIELETRDVRVAGRAFAETLTVHPKAPMRFDDVVFVGEDAQLGLAPKGANTPASRVELTVRYGDTQRRKATFACADVALGRGARSSPASLVKGWHDAKPVVVLARPSTPLFETEHGSSVSVLERARHVRLLEAKGPRSRIASERAGTIEVGWVPSSAIAPATTVLEKEGRVVSIEDTNSVNPLEEHDPPPAAPWPRVVCGHDVRLVAVFKEFTAYRIGDVKAGVPLALKNDAPKAGYMRVLRGSLDLTAQSETELLVPKRDLADCVEKAAP